MAEQLSKRARLARQALWVLSFALVCALLTALQLAFTPKGPVPWWWPQAWIAWFNADRNGRFVALLTAAMTAASLGIGLFQVFLSVTLRETEERIKSTVVEHAADIKTAVQLAENVTEAVRKTTERTETKLDLVLAGLGLSKTQLDKVLTAFDQSLHGLNLSPEEAETKLVDLAHQFVLRVEAAERSTNDRPEIAAQRLAAAAALREGEFGRAETMFGEIAAQHLEAGKTEILSAVAALVDQGGAARLRNDLLSAADHFHRAAEIAAPLDAASAFSAQIDEAFALYDHGRLFPGLDLLRRSAAVWRELEKSAPSAEQRAAVQIDLGNALSKLGERAGGAQGIDALKEAAAAYRAALTVRTQTNMPVEWAATQNNLATVLYTLGKRTGGAEGFDALNQAVAIYQAALTVRTQDATPADWAMTQKNLGLALAALGERTGGPKGIELLKEAIAAHRAALSVYTLANKPADWASTQNSLGLALWAQGEMRGGAEGVEALNQAASAFRATLTVCNQTDMPADWAAAQNNLGLALAVLGKLVGGTEGVEALNQAATAYRAALTVRTQAKMPADWAFTIENLALAYKSLTEFDGDLTRLDQAIALMNQAIPAFEAMQATYNVQKAQRNRAAMVALRDRLAGGTRVDFPG